MDLRILQNDKGMALVTSLMLTLISLTIVLGLLFMITKSTQLSGMTKRYRTAMDASYGGSELIVKEVIPAILQNYSSSTLVTKVQTDFSGFGLAVGTTQQCLQAKLSQSTANWPAGCSQTPNANKSPDLSFSLQATTATPYTVYAKIIDTVKGNSDLSGMTLEGAGVAEGQTIITPMHIPYIYRVEVQGERSENAKENAQLSVLYAY